MQTQGVYSEVDEVNGSHRYRFFPRHLCYCLTPGAVLVLILFVSGAALAGDYVVRLYPVVKVNGSDLSLADLTSRHSSAALQEVLARTGILTATQEAGGYPTRIRRIDIERAFNESNPSWRGRVEFLGPQSILVRAGAKRLPATKLERVARRCLEQKLAREPQQYRNVGFRPAQKIADTDVPVATPVLQARCNPGRGLMGRELVWVDIIAAGRTMRSIPVWFAASGSRLAYVLKDAVAERVHLKPALLVRRYVELSAIASPLYRGEPGADQLRFRRGANPGQVLVSDLLIDVPAVEMGAMVSVGAAVGKVAIETRALAMTDADIGERVRLKSLSSEQYFNARVVGENLAIVAHTGNNTGT